MHPIIYKSNYIQMKYDTVYIRWYINSAIVICVCVQLVFYNIPFSICNQDKNILYKYN